jgi:phage shock protein C
MQPRLSRSTSERMVAGVCGGLAEYFNIDPVIVRLIFVLVTLTSGIGLPVYILLWVIMPREVALSGQEPFERSAQQLSEDAAQPGQQFSQEASRFSREVLVGQRSGEAHGRSAQAGRGTPEYRLDPAAEQPFESDSPSTGRTVNLGMPPADLPAPYAQPAPRRTRRWNTLGVILIGIGGLIFLEQFGIDMSLIFPTLLIVAGAILMRRKR